jgi:hypothetical protein
VIEGSCTLGFKLGMAKDCGTSRSEASEGDVLVTKVPEIGVLETDASSLGVLRLEGSRS